MSQAEITMPVKGRHRKRLPRKSSKATHFDAYVVTCIANGKEYVGITTSGIKRRWIGHRSDAKKGKFASLLHRAMRKFGEDAFRIELAACARDWAELCDLEAVLIEQRRTFHPYGYNLTKGGDGVLGIIPSDKTRERMSVSGRKRLSDPVALDEHRLRAIQATSEPTWKTAHTMGVRRNAEDPTWPERYAVGRRKLTSDPEFLARCQADADRKTTERDALDPVGASKRAHKRARQRELREAARQGIALPRLTRGHKAGSPLPPRWLDAMTARAEHNDIVNPDGADRRAEQRKQDEIRRMSKRAALTNIAVDLSSLLLIDVHEPPPMSKKSSAGRFKRRMPIAQHNQLQLAL